MGKRDSGVYQNDPVLGPDAVVTRTPTWTVQTQIPLRITNEGVQGTGFALHFVAEAGKTYTVEYAEIPAALTWLKELDVAAQPSTGDYAVTNLTMGSPQRFYRVVTPARP